MLWLRKTFSNIVSTIKDFLTQLSRNAVPAYSAQAAFYILISLFPLIMLTMTVIHYLPIAQDEIQDMLFSFMPWETRDFMKNIMTDIYSSASGTLISITAVTTLWAASSGVFALMNGINSVYKVPEQRGFVRLRAMSVIYTLFFILFLVGTMGILVFGDSFARAVVGIIILTVFSLVVYLLIPNRKGKIRNEIVGAIVSSIGWVVFSYLFSFYIDNFSNYSRFYGSMTAIVLLMLWLYFCMYIMLVGAQINVFIQKTGDGSVD